METFRIEPCDIHVHALVIFGMFTYTTTKETRVNMTKKCHYLNQYPQIDWLQSLKHFFINVSYHILVASLTLMALF